MGLGDNGQPLLAMGDNRFRVGEDLHAVLGQGDAGTEKVFFGIKCRFEPTGITVGDLDNTNFTGMLGNRILDIAERGYGDLGTLCHLEDGQPFLGYDFIAVNAQCDCGHVNTKPGIRGWG